MPPKINLTGQRLGRLVVVRQVENRGKNIRWECRCDCGNTRITSSSNLLVGDTKSCGCLQRDTVGALRRKHGLTGTPTHSSWKRMFERCTNPKRRDYRWYGGRGITICDRWMTFVNFLADMGMRPEGMTLDRIDNSKGYFLGNCRWATWSTQFTNMRRSGSRNRGSKNGQSKLREDDVYKIRDMLRSGLQARAIAKLFKVSEGAIYLIKHNKKWRHLPEMPGNLI